MIPNAIFTKKIFKLFSVFSVFIYVQPVLYAGKNDSFTSKPSEVISNLSWIQKQKVESTKGYYDVIRNYYNSPTFRKLPKAHTAHILFKKIGVSRDSGTDGERETFADLQTNSEVGNFRSNVNIREPSVQSYERGQQDGLFDTEQIGSSKSSANNSGFSSEADHDPSGISRQADDFAEIYTDDPSDLPIETILTESDLHPSTTDSDRPVEDGHNGSANVSSQSSTDGQNLNESDSVDDVNQRTDPQSNIADNNGANGSSDDNDSFRQVPQARRTTRARAASRANTAPNSAQTGGGAGVNQTGNQPNQVLNQPNAAVGQQVGQQNMQQNIPQIAQVNGPQKILDTSHEHTFVARSVARLIHADVEHQMRENMPGDTNKEISSANSNSLWARGMYGHSHKTSPGLPHNDKTTGVLIGYNRAISDQQIIGVFAGYSDTNIDYKKNYRGTHSKQKGWAVGACTSIRPSGGRLIISDVFLISQNTYSDDVKRNSQQRIAKSHTKYHGISCSNKITTGLIYQKGDHIFCPEFAVSLDYITQKKHAHVSPNGVLARENKSHDLFVTCSGGVRYTQRSSKNIQPSIFLGYEWTAIRKIGTRSADKNLLMRPSAVNGNHAILDARLNFRIADQTSLALGYIGNYGKHYTFSGAQLSLARQF